jgi:hypothetical protein
MELAVQLLSSPTLAPQLLPHPELLPQLSHPEKYFFNIIGPVMDATEDQQLQ